MVKMRLPTKISLSLPLIIKPFRTMNDFEDFRILSELIMQKS